MKKTFFTRILPVGSLCSSPLARVIAGEHKLTCLEDYVKYTLAVVYKVRKYAKYARGKYFIHQRSLLAWFHKHAASISTPFEWDAGRKLAAVLILALFLLFLLLSSQRVSSQSRETLRELQNDPCRGVTKLEGFCDSYESRPRTQPTGMRKARRRNQPGGH